MQTRVHFWMVMECNCTNVTNGGGVVCGVYIYIYKKKQREREREQKKNKIKLEINRKSRLCYVKKITIPR